MITMTSHDGSRALKLPWLCRFALRFSGEAREAEAGMGNAHEDSQRVFSFFNALIGVFVFSRNPFGGGASI